AVPQQVAQAASPEARVIFFYAVDAGQIGGECFSALQVEVAQLAAIPQAQEIIGIDLAGQVGGDEEQVACPGQGAQRAVLLQGQHVHGGGMAFELVEGLVVKPHGGDAVGIPLAPEFITPDVV